MLFKMAKKSGKRAYENPAFLPSGSIIPISSIYIDLQFPMENNDAENFQHNLPIHGNEGSMRQENSEALNLLSSHGDHNKPTDQVDQDAGVVTEIPVELGNLANSTSVAILHEQESNSGGITRQDFLQPCNEENALEVQGLSKNLNNNSEEKVAKTIGQEFSGDIPTKILETNNQQEGGLPEAGNDSDENEKIAAMQLLRLMNDPKSTDTGLNDVGLNELLEGIIKPDSSYPSTNDNLAGAVEYMEKGLILALKNIPVSNFKDMITAANGTFVSLGSLHLNYSALYHRVKNYVKSSALLASIENSKSEDVASQQYDDLRKLHYEGTLRAYNEITTSMSESNKRIRLLEDDILASKERLKKLETEFALREVEIVSRACRLGKDSQVLKKSEEEARRAFENAKAALDQ